MNKTIVSAPRIPYYSLGRRYSNVKDGSVNLRHSGSSKCLCQVQTKQVIQNRSHSWQAYVKFRKYGLVCTTASCSGMLNLRTLSKAYPESQELWRVRSVNYPARLSMLIGQRSYSSSASDNQGENSPSRNTEKKQRRRKPEIPPPVSPPLTYSSLPDEVKADLQSLNHFAGSDDTKRRLDPQEFSAVSSRIIEEFLKESEVPYERGYTSFYMKCPRYVKARAVKALKENSRLYVNSLSGFFECRACGKSGKWDSLKQNMNDITKRKGKKPTECFATLPTETRSFQAPEEVATLYNEAILLSSLTQNKLSEILEGFGMQKIKLQTLLQLGVTYDAKSGSLLFPYFGYDRQLVGVKIMTPERSLAADGVIDPVDDESESRDYESESKDVEEDSIDQEKQEVLIKSILLPSNLVGLFGLASKGNKRIKEVILANSEVDALAIGQETGQVVVSLPNGVEGLKQEALPIFESFSHVTIWFGGDVQGWDAAKEYGCRLNQNRCSIIRPDTENSSAYKCLMQGSKLKDILNKKSEMVHKAIIDFRKLRNEVYSEISQEKTVAGIQWQRYSALNRVIKGHRKGELTVFTGPTGAGKTTFISDYSLDLCMQGVRTLWGSFEVNNVRLLRTMLSQYARENLSHNLDKFDHWANDFEDLPMYFMTFHGQEELEVVIDTMAHAAYVYNIHHVVIDNLQFMMGMAKNALDRFFQQDNAIQKLRQFATDYNIHVTLVMHPRKEVPGEDLSLASIFGGAKATQEADNVIILQDRRLVSTRGRKYLQIVKNRYAGELSILGLKFNKESISFDLLLPEDRRKKQNESEENTEGGEKQSGKVGDPSDESPLNSSAFQNFFQG